MQYIFRGTVVLSAAPLNVIYKLFQLSIDVNLDCFRVNYSRIISNL